MPPLKQIKRRDLIYYLKQLGFGGPYSGKRHQFLLKDSLRVTIPNPHQDDISANFLAKIWGQAKVDINDWENLSILEGFVNYFK
jgi:predicted RNA binding protein YcfA (HicA-like mRNA interferase family)